MVDSIKAANIAAQGARASTETLRSNFRNLSAGPAVQEGADATKVTPMPSHIAEELNSAKYVENVAHDIEKLRAEAHDLVTQLQDYTDGSEDIAVANVESAKTQLEDVDAAQEAASRTGQRITFNAEESMKAHSGLNANRVAELLTE